MRWVAVALVVIACSKAEPPKPKPSVAPITIDASIVASPDAPPAFVGVDITPLKMVGPAKTLAASCATITPCGNTAPADSNKRILPKNPDCSLVLEETQDAMAVNDKGQPQKLKHAVGDAEVRIGAVACAIPEGLRFDAQKYYAFVKRADGWWHSDGPLFSYDFNNKYCGASMLVRWNAQPNRTFAGVAASISCLECRKNANATHTREMMIRFEPQRAQPVVFPIVEVGSRLVFERMFDKPDPGDTDLENCPKNSKNHTSLTETWSGEDELTLTGASLDQFIPVAGGMSIDALGASGAGSYRFVR